jgi:hypothetical protein
VAQRFAAADRELHADPGHDRQRENQPAEALPHTRGARHRDRADPDERDQRDRKVNQQWMRGQAEELRDVDGGSVRTPASPLTVG